MFIPQVLRVHSLGILNYALHLPPNDKSSLHITTLRILLDHNPMTGFTTTLRGDGLVRAQRALASLEGDPLRLDRERGRFSHSPPPYTSNPSTRSATPNDLSEEQRLRKERRAQLWEDREASQPYEQFSRLVNELEKQNFEADVNGTRRIPVGSDPRTIALETVRKLWLEQGIWNNNWNQFADGQWKHEEPLQPGSESETDSEARSSPPRFSFFPKPQPKPRQPISDDQKRRIAARRAIREREREASRPYHQFVFQISKERERIEKELESGEDANTANINTRAYENVKKSWTRRRIWNRKWGILPGMSWKHEEPVEEEAADGPAPVPANQAVDGTHEAAKAPAAPFFKPLFGPPSPVKSNHGQAPGGLNSSQQSPPVNIDSTESENGVDAESSSYMSVTAQALPPSQGNASHMDGQPSNASLGPVHSSRVAKVAGKRKGPQRRLNISQEIPSDGLPLFSGVNATEPQLSPPPVPSTPRRSKRIQAPVPSLAQDPAKTAVAVPLKRAPRSHPEQKVANNLTGRSSAKPQGVSKKQTAKTTRGKARKE